MAGIFTDAEQPPAVGALVWYCVRCRVVRAEELLVLTAFDVCCARCGARCDSLFPELHQEVRGDVGRAFAPEEGRVFQEMLARIQRERDQARHAREAELADIRRR